MTITDQVLNRLLADRKVLALSDYFRWRRRPVELLRQLIAILAMDGEEYEVTRVQRGFPGCRVSDPHLTSEAHRDAVLA